MPLLDQRGGGAVMGRLQTDMLPAAQARKRLTAKQKRMQRAIRFLADYMGSYEQQAGCLDYTEKTLIDDVLYGLGLALDPEAHKWARGYEAWKQKLIEHLSADRALFGASTTCKKL